MLATKTVAPSKAKPAPKDAIALLKADHEAVSQMFTKYEKTRSVPYKKDLIADICTALSVHAHIDEELFYPTMKTALKDKLLVPEASVEHAGAKYLMAQIESLEPHVFNELFVH